MDLQEVSEGLRKNILYLGISLLIVISVTGAKNMITPEEPVKVGYTEVRTECVGLNTGICIGLQRRTHTTYNYAKYKEPEKGTENFYRKIESELMLRAYSTCNSSMNGYDWTSKVSYKNKTAAEWRKNENVQLLPCEKTFYRPLNATS